MKALSLSTFLSRLVWLCVLPPVILASYFALHEVWIMRDQRSQEAEDQVRNVATDIDNRLQALILSLEVLAASSSIDGPPQLIEFYNECKAFQKILGVHVILADASKQMVLNTREPYGVLLPKLPPSTGHAAAPAVLATGKPAVGDIVFGPVAKEPLVAIAVPVIRDNQSKFLILSTIETRQFQQRLDQLSIPKGWAVTVLDGAGQVIARRSPTGVQKGSYEEDPRKSLVAKSAVSHWSVVLDIPGSLYRSQLLGTSATLAISVLAVTCISVVGGRAVARRLNRSVGELAEARMEGVSQPAISEIEAVRKKLEDSAEARDQAVAKLRDSEEKLRLFIAHAPAAIAMFDRDMRYLAVSSHWISDYCLAEGDIIGRSHYDIFPEIPDRWKEAYQRGLEGEVVSADEDRFDRGEGSVQWKRWEVRPWRNFSGAIGGIIIFTEEITERKQAEEILKKNEERLRLALEAAKAGIWEWDLLTNENFWSDELWKLYGLEPNSCKPSYETWLETIHPDDQETAERAVQEAVSKETELTAEWRTKDVNGGSRWLMSRGRPIPDANGRAVSYLGIVMDITYRKTADQALRESEKRYRGVVEGANDIIYSTDVNGSFRLFNAVGLRITGYSPEEISRKRYLDLIHPDYKSEVERFYGIQYVKRLSDTYCEVPIVTKDCRTVWIGQNVQLIMENDTILGFQAIARDVTDRKKAEEALAESELLYHNLFKGARDAIIIMDMEGDATGRIISANPVAAKIHGYTLDEFVGLSLEDLESPDSAKGLQTRIDTVLSGQALRAEVNHCRKDGSVFPMEVSANLLEIRGHKYCIGIDRDISERKLVEDTLAGERSKFKSILDHMIDGVYIVNPEYEIEYVNPALVSERGEVEGRKCHEYLSGLTEPCPWCRNREVLAGKSLLWERTSDVTGKTYDIFETPIKNQDGSTSILLILHDVTERKVSDKLLCESEQRYRALISSAGNGIIVQDDTWKIVTWNKEAERIFGISAEEALGVTSTEYKWETFKEDGSPLPGSEHPSLRTLATGESLRDQVVKVVRPSGAFSWVNMNTAPIFGEDDSKPIAVIITLTDFTERKEIERAMRENEQFLRQTERIARVGGWRANPFTDELHWTQGVHEIIEAPLDYKPGLEEGLKFYKPQYIPLLKAMLTETLESGMPHAMEVEVVTTSGKQLWTEVRSLMRVDESGRSLVLGTFQDITERKNLERQFAQAQKMEAIGTLAGGVAHDFNNILQVAFGYSEIILSDDHLPECYRADVQRINESAKRGADLIQRLLTFSRKTEITPQPLDLNARITDLRKMLERTLPKMVDIQLTQDVKLAKINADKIQVDQVLMNLAVNARDAMPEGGRLLFETSNVTLDEEDARSHLDIKPGPHVLLAVTDTGAGMDKETLEHIFEPFYTTKGVGEGTGLGLAMVHGIVKRHGGHISCHSDLGKGTTFKIYFPAIITEEDEPQTPEKPTPRGGSETILLVDDEVAILDLGTRILTKAGYKVITASNGKEALDTYRRRGGEIALILLDLMMPEMGGKQCLEELLSLDPSVKVIIASGYSATGPTKDALVAGAKTFVNKPYDILQVLGVVRSTLDEDRGAV
jgi:two-component system, cell cycle sensor histidine kinase and response regulator CckA